MIKLSEVWKRLNHTCKGVSASSEVAQWICEHWKNGAETALDQITVLATPVSQDTCLLWHCKDESMHAKNFKKNDRPIVNAVKMSAAIIGL
jgi:hypothetical protein